MSTTATSHRRVTRVYRQSIEAPPDVVWPLLCPVREAEWLNGWKYTLIHSESGFAEEGAVFTTPGDGEPDTVWVVTRHDPAEGRVELARVTPGSRVCHLKVAVSPAGATTSHVDISYANTALSPAGEEFLDGWTEEAFLAAMSFWERSMNHYLRTGERLAHE